MATAPTTAPALTKEEIAKAEAALDAEEIMIRRKRCVLRGHKWDVPGVSPFNHGHLIECEIICNRCNAHAVLRVTDIKDT
jgi:hypothetical protein